MQNAGPPKAIDVTPPPEVLSAALRTAEEQAPPAYSMDVSCVDARGPRSLRLFRSGTSVWNRSTQVVVPPDARRNILAMLRRADYATMANSYGGKKKAEVEAALSVRCEVAVDFGKVAKISVQLSDGEQSPRVEGLASEILDYVESLGLQEESATSLSEALKKWVAGGLNPEILTLRILQIPPAKGQEGLIVEVLGGEVIRRRYAHGKGVSQRVVEPLDRAKLLTLLNVFVETDFENMPANLMSDETVEVDVWMLGHKKKVIARKFGRALPPEMAAAQGRFDRLLVAMRDFAGRLDDVR